MVASALERLRADGLVVSRRGAGSWTAIPPAAARRHEPPGDPDRPVIDLARAAPPAIAGHRRRGRGRRCPGSAAELASHGYYEQGMPELRERLARAVHRARPADHAGPGAGHQRRAHRARHGAAAVRRARRPGADRAADLPERDRGHPRRARHPGAGRDDRATAGTSTASRPPCARPRPGSPTSIVDFHNPTGHRLDAAGRQRLGAALRRARTPVVVDETQVELDFERRRGAAAVRRVRRRPGARHRLGGQVALGRAAARLDPGVRGDRQPARRRAPRAGPRVAGVRTAACSPSCSTAPREPLRERARAAGRAAGRAGRTRRARSARTGRSRCRGAG